MCSFPISYNLHAFSPPSCSYCQSCDHDANSCLYYDISDACYAKLNVIIETMKEQYDYFVGEMRECVLLCEIDPSPSSPRLEVSFYDDYESSFPLKPNFMVDLPLTGLEKVINPPLPSSSFIAPSLSSTPRDTTKHVLILLSSSLPLA